MTVQAACALARARSRQEPVTTDRVIQVSLHFCRDSPEVATHHIERQAETVDADCTSLDIERLVCELGGAGRRLLLPKFKIKDLALKSLR